MFNRLMEFGDKFARLVGDKTDFGARINPFQSEDIAKFDTVLNYGSWSEMLHYNTYDSDSQIFYNKSSYGFILEVSLLTGASEETVNILASILTDVLPEGVDLQFLLLLQ